MRDPFYLSRMKIILALLIILVACLVVLVTLGGVDYLGVRTIYLVIAIVPLILGLVMLVCLIKFAHKYRCKRLQYYVYTVMIVRASLMHVMLEL